MRIGIFAKTFPQTGAEAVLGAVCAAGYGCAQFNMACLGLPSMPDAIEASDAASVASAARRTGVAVAAVSGTYNMIHPDPKQRDKGLARLKLLIANAPAMGTGLVTLCTGTRNAQDQWAWHPDNAGAEAWRDLVVEMGKAVEAAEHHDVDLGIEPELANVVASADLARRLLDEIGSPRLRIVLDPANLFEVAGREQRLHLVEHAIDRLADRLAMAHAKDRAPDGSFVAAGRGVVDLPHFVRELTKAGFSGPLVTHGLTQAEAPQVARYLAQVIAEAGA